MALRINFNYSAAVTQTALEANNRLMNKSLMRLSTGLRILNAADDSAGLFIADQLAIVSAGLEQGNRNIQTGISALQIAENSAGQIYNRLKQIYVKAENAANDINDPNARAALQREINNLVNAIQRIATDTEYNGIKLLDGTFTGKYIQYGARANQGVNISISNLQTSALGAYTAGANGPVVAQTDEVYTSTGTGAVDTLGTGGLDDSTGWAGNEVTVDAGDSLSITIGSLPTVTLSGSQLGVNTTDFGSNTFVDAKTIADNINADSTLQSAGVTATAVNSKTAATAWGTNLGTVATSDAGTTVDGSITIRLYVGDQKVFENPYNFSGAQDGDVVGPTLSEIINDINNSSSNGGLVVAEDDGGKLKLTTQNGETVLVEVDVSVQGNGTAGTAQVDIDLSKFVADGTAATLSVQDDNVTDTTARTGTGSAVQVGDLNLRIDTDDPISVSSTGIGFTGLNTFTTVNTPVRLNDVAWAGTDAVVDAGDSLDITVGSETVKITGSDLGITNPDWGTNTYVDAYKIMQSINSNSQLGISATATNSRAASSAWGAGLASVTFTDNFNDDTLSASGTIKVTIYAGDKKVFEKTYTGTINETDTAFGPDLDTIIEDINSSPVNSGLLSASKDDTGTKLKLTTANGETVLVEVEASVTLNGSTNGVNDKVQLDIDLGKFVENSSAPTISVSDDGTFNGVTVAGSAVQVGKLDIIGTDSFSVSATGIGFVGINTTTFESLDQIEVLSNEKAQRAMLIVQTAIRKVDTVRSQIGAVMNNLQSIYDAQKVAWDNTKEAENVIRNVDFTKEMSTFTTMQIRMQSGIAMLAQANTLPQLVLQLLR